MFALVCIAAAGGLYKAVRGQQCHASASPRRVPAPACMGICCLRECACGCNQTGEYMRLQEAALGAPMHHALVGGHARVGWLLLRAATLGWVLAV